jgi:hypothetical protein
MEHLWRNLRRADAPRTDLPGAGYLACPPRGAKAETEADQVQGSDRKSHETCPGLFFNEHRCEVARFSSYLIRSGEPPPIALRLIPVAGGATPPPPPPVADDAGAAALDPLRGLAALAAPELPAPDEPPPPSRSIAELPLPALCFFAGDDLTASVFADWRAAATGLVAARLASCGTFRRGSALAAGWIVSGWATLARHASTTVARFKSSLRTDELRLSAASPMQ